MIVEALEERNARLLNSLRRKRLPRATEQMIRLHIEKPWAPGQIGILVSPVGKDLEEFLEEPMLDDSRRLWWYPSMTWWRAHAMASHPPDGSGCDADAHISFLTARGDNYEFDYANVFEDGSLKILKRRDFVEECRWWGSFF